MKLKNDRIEGEVFVVGKDLFDAVQHVDEGWIHPNEDVAEAASSWPEKVYRVEVTIYEV